MTRKYLVNGVVMADGTTLIKGRADGLDSAADGSVAAGTVIIRDPVGAQVFKPWCEFAVEDDACSSPRSWTGYLANMQINRGEYAIGVTSGSPRSWSFELFDLNGLLHRQALHYGTANKRPAENGNARLAWLLGSEALSGLVYDNGQVASNPWSFGEADYRGKFADEVLADLSASSVSEDLGPLSFVYWDGTAAAGHEASLFYDTPTSTLGTSSISLSNVDADVNNTSCFWIHPDPIVDRKGEDIYCGVAWEGKDGGFYRHSAATHAAYFADTNIHRDGTFSTDRISRNDSSAIPHADQWLATHARPIDTIKLTARLTPSVVNLLNAGMRVSVKMPHLPGYASATYLRVNRRTLPIEEGKRVWYDVPLELSNKGIAQTGGSGGTFPHPPVGVVSVVQQGIVPLNGVTGSFNMTSAPGAGNLIVLVTGWRSTPSSPSIATGFTQVGSDVAVTLPGTANQDCVSMAYRIAQSGDTAAISYITTSSKGHTTAYIELAGDWASNPLNVTGSSTGSGVAPTVSITPTASQNGVVIGGAINGNNNTPQDTNYVAGTGYTLIGQSTDVGGHPETGGVYKLVSSTTGSYAPAMTATSGFPGDGSLSAWGMIAAAFVQSAAVVPPTPGRQVPWAVVTMAGAVGTTLFPYATGSLLVKVDGVLISRASYTETSPAAGTFTLSWTPDTDEVVTVMYQGI